MKRRADTKILTPVSDTNASELGWIKRNGSGHKYQVAWCGALMYSRERPFRTVKPCIGGSNPPPGTMLVKSKSALCRAPTLDFVAALQRTRGLYELVPGLARRIAELSVASRSNGLTALAAVVADGVQRDDGVTDRDGAIRCTAAVPDERSYSRPSSTP